MQEKPIMKVNGSGWKIALTTICALTVLAQFILIVSWCLRLVPTPWHRNSTPPAGQISLPMHPLAWISVSPDRNRERADLMREPDELIVDVECPHNATFTGNSSDSCYYIIDGPSKYGSGFGRSLMADCQPDIVIASVDLDNYRHEPFSLENSRKWQPNNNDISMNYIKVMAVQPFITGTFPDFETTRCGAGIIAQPKANLTESAVPSKDPKRFDRISSKSRSSGTADSAISATKSELFNDEWCGENGDKSGSASSQNQEKSPKSIGDQKPSTESAQNDTVKPNETETEAEMENIAENRLMIDTPLIKPTAEAKKQQIESPALTKIEIIVAGHKIIDFSNADFIQQQLQQQQEYQKEQKLQKITTNDDVPSTTINAEEQQKLEQTEPEPEKQTQQQQVEEQQTKEEQQTVVETLATDENSVLIEEKVENLNEKVSTNKLNKNANARQMRILQIGLAGSALNNFFAKNFAQHEILVLETEPIIKYLAQKYFGLNENTCHRVIVGEPLHTLAELKNQNYDFIAVDACQRGNSSANYSQPTCGRCPSYDYRRHLGVAYLQRLLAENGTLVVNVFSPERNEIDTRHFVKPDELTHADQELLRFYRTYFPHCYYVVIGANKILTCTKASVPRMTTERYQRHLRAAKLPSSLSTFSDPVEPRIYDNPV